MISIRRITLLGNFKYIESEFRLRVRQRILLVKNNVAEFVPQSWIEEGLGAICCQTVAVVIGRVVRKGADRKSVFVQILCVPKQGLNEIPTPYIMRQVAEKMASIGIVAHVLDDRAAVGIGLRFAQLIFRRARKPRQ